MPDGGVAKRNNLSVDAPVRKAIRAYRRLPYANGQFDAVWLGRLLDQRLVALIRR